MTMVSLCHSLPDLRRRAVVRFRFGFWLGDFIGSIERNLHLPLFDRKGKFSSRYRSHPAKTGALRESFVIGVN